MALHSEFWLPLFHFRKGRKHEFGTGTIRELIRKDALLDLMLVNRGLAGEVAVGRLVGHSDHEAMEFKIFGNLYIHPLNIADLEAVFSSVFLITRHKIDVNSKFLLSIKLC